MDKRDAPGSYEDLPPGSSPARPFPVWLAGAGAQPGVLAPREDNLPGSSHARRRAWLARITRRRLARWLWWDFRPGTDLDPADAGAVVPNRRR
jgi:hypothetical protein